MFLETNSKHLSNIKIIQMAKFNTLRDVTHPRLRPRDV